MSLAENKLFVADFFQRFSNTDRPGALLDEHVIWQAMGEVGGLPMSDTMDKEAIGNLITFVRSIMPEDIRLTPSTWAADGDRVSTEIESYGVKTDGTVYNNFYHFLVRLCDGKITLTHEYMDTNQVRRIFINDQ